MTLAVFGAIFLALPGSEARGQTDGRSLGRLEQESVDETLGALGLTIDPRPEGKTVGDIHVVNQEVFSRRDWRFQWFNIFHRTTRSQVLRRDLLIKPGQPYDDALVEESIRNLQSPPPLVFGGKAFAPPELSSVVAIQPVVSHRPGEVDLLVVTRDIWSLRFNTAFEFQQGTLAFLSTSLSENNLFGWRKYLSAGFLMDQGKMGFGPTTFDPNIRGTRLTLYASAIAWYARETQRYEGNNETVLLRYPLYALSSRWGAGIDVTHQDAVIRSFRGNNLRRLTVTLPSGTTTPDTTASVPYIFRRKIVTVDTSVVRSFGVAVIQRVTVGHLFDGRRSELLRDYVDVMATQPFLDPGVAQSFLDQFAPVSEQRSEPYLRYEMFTPRYGVFRNLDTFDLRENRRLGPSLTLRIAYGLPALGADFRAFVFGGAAAWAVGRAGGYGLVRVSTSARLRDGRLIDQNFGALVYGASPLLGRVVRLVVSGEADAVRADSLRTLYFLGGSTGLRGYAIGDFQGTSQVIGHVELRFAPLAVFSQRFGSLLFYDVGDVAPSFATIVPHHDMGFGLRWLIPQFNSSVLRFDWAFATQSTPFTRAGWPGRVTAGLQQVF